MPTKDNVKNLMWCIKNKDLSRLEKDRISLLLSFCNISYYCKFKLREIY